MSKLLLKKPLRSKYESRPCTTASGIDSSTTINTSLLATSFPISSRRRKLSLTPFSAHDVRHLPARGVSAYRRPDLSPPVRRGRTPFTVITALPVGVLQSATSRKSCSCRWPWVWPCPLVIVRAMETPPPLPRPPNPPRSPPRLHDHRQTLTLDQSKLPCNPLWSTTSTRANWSARTSVATSTTSRSRPIRSPPTAAVGDRRGIGRTFARCAAPVGRTECSRQERQWRREDCR